MGVCKVCYINYNVFSVIFKNKSTWILWQKIIIFANTVYFVNRFDFRELKFTNTWKISTHLQTGSIRRSTCIYLFLFWLKFLKSQLLSWAMNSQYDKG